LSALAYERRDYKRTWHERTRFIHVRLSCRLHFISFSSPIENLWTIWRMTCKTKTEQIVNSSKTIPYSSSVRKIEFSSYLVSFSITLSFVITHAMWQRLISHGGLTYLLYSADKICSVHQKFILEDPFHCQTRALKQEICEMCDRLCTVAI